MTEESAASRLVGEMARCLDRGEGYRFGESTVVSRRVHLLTAQNPGDVEIVSDADAGRVFYHRRQEGQILHLDIFHEVAEVNHREIASRVAAAAARYARDYRRGEGGTGAGAGAWGRRRLADYVDVQTATGGGRVTGSLAYGRGQTLQASHSTHVHLALLAGPRDLHIVPYLIMAAEDEIRRQGFQIRRIERCNNTTTQNSGAGLDLSEYASPSDSLLREAKRDWTPPGEGATMDNPSYLRGVLDLADEFGGITELADILDSLAGSPTWSQLHRKLRSRVPVNQVLSRLEGEGLLNCERGTYELTEGGLGLRDYVVRHHREIELRFKQTLRKLPFCGRPGRKPAVPTQAVRPMGRGPVSYRSVVSAEAGAWLGSLAVPETVVRALSRRTTISAGPAAGPGARGPGASAGSGARGSEASAGTAARSGVLDIQRGDLLVHRRRGLGPLDVCLVIDASASMAGPRMRAAKYLAQHLLLSTRDRVAVVVFQEREAGLYVPFTRNFRAVERGLGRIRPLGLTPLAEGLTQAASYVAKERTRDPLLLLITDGIPTVPRWTMNPVADALTAAQALAKNRIRFSCIGLEPNLGFLKDLAAGARGTLHIVEELEQSLLSEIAHSERRRMRL